MEEALKDMEHLTEYEEHALAAFLHASGGAPECLDENERMRLLELLAKAGCRRYWGLSLVDVRRMEGQS